MDLGIDEEGHLAPRREFNPYAPVRPNALHCFGVDFMSNKEVLKAFAVYEPETIEWLDDSSCNIVFKDAEAVAKVLEEFAEMPPDPEDPWIRSKPVLAGGIVGQPKMSACREIHLELRAATEEDRKDLGHSGHTDSVYYAHVKEQQALQKQRKEMQQLKKKQRRSRLPVAQDSGDQSRAVAMETAESATSSSSVAIAKVEVGQQLEPLKLGTRGLLDPLLFLRAPGSTCPTVGKPQGAHDVNAGTDLRTMLQQAEAEYAAIPGASQPQLHLQQASALRGRQPRRSNEKALAKQSQTPQLQERGKKRRPVSQEPRPVSAVAPPPRKVLAYPQVEDFLKESGLRCQKFALQKSFRSINLASKKPKIKPHGETDETVEPKPVKKLPPWEEYFYANSNFIRQGQFMATVAFDAAGRRVLAVVPHAKRVSVEHMARAAQVTVGVLRQLKLKDIEKETGFPTFVCPPFGHPKDSQGRLPLLLVDSSISELKKGRPLLFDCGHVGLSVMPHEFVSIARAVCVEGLAKDVEAQTAGVSTSPAAVNGVVAEQDSKAVAIGELLPNCVKPELSFAVQGHPLTEVQHPAEVPRAAGDEIMKS